MFSARFQELASSVAATAYSAREGVLSEMQAFQQALQLLSQTSERGGVAYIIGNGGSAGIASHFSCDLMKTLKIPSFTLYDSNLVTCLSNDIGYEQVFSFPLERVLKPQDLLVAISSSGKSPNIIQAAETALSAKVSLITLSGFLESNPLRKMGDLNFWVNRCDYGLVETAHFFLLHTIIDLWNSQLPSVKEYVQILKSRQTK